MKPTSYALLYDKAEVHRVLMVAARAMAMDINTDVNWEDYPSIILETVASVVKWTPFVRHLLAENAGVQGAATVDINYCKFHDDRRSFFEMFYRNWIRMTEAGPEQGLRYLAEKSDQAKRSMRNMQDRFELARKVNNIVSGELNKSIAWTFYVKTSADVGMNAMGTWGPSLGFLGNTAVLVGYTAACKLAESVEEGNLSDIVGVVDIANLEAGTIGNYAQEVTQTHEAAARKIADSMLASRNAVVEEGFRKPGRFLPSAGNMTEEWMVRTSRLGRAAVNAENAAARASLASSAARGGSFAVALLFMAPQLKTALATGNPFSEAGQEAIAKRLSR